VITKKQKADIIAEYGNIIISIINIISKSEGRAEEKMRLVSFLLMVKDVVDLEKERLDYDKVLDAVQSSEAAHHG